MPKYKPIAFRVDSSIHELLSEDAALQHSSESAVLRQIIHRHYEARLKERASGLHGVTQQPQASVNVAQAA